MTENSTIRRTDRSLPIAMLRARETVMAPLRVMLAKAQVNEQQWRVLRVVDEGGAMEQTAIAEAACLLLPSLTRMLQGMEKSGLVVRRTDAADRRKTIVEVTDAGQDLIRTHLAESQAIFARLEAAYGREKLETLLDLLEDLRQIRL